MTTTLGEGWDAVAAVLQTDTSRAYRYAKCLRYLPSSVSHTASICDIGCGEGSGLALLGDAGYTHLTGIEVSGERLRRARANLGPGTDLIQIGTDGRVPVADGSFDVAISAAVIEHTSDPAGHVRELARIVRAGGVVIIASDCYTYRMMQIIGVYRSPQPIDRAIFPPALVRYFRRSGLRLVHSEGFPIPGEEYRILRLLMLAAARIVRRVIPKRPRTAARVDAAPVSTVPDPGPWRPNYWIRALPGLLFSDENVFFLVKDA